VSIKKFIINTVNDAFVMRQWGKMQGLEEETADNVNCALNPGNFKRVKLIPDGAAAFTRGMGMSCHFNCVGGFGERSWRYSAVINDMKIEKLFIEEGGVIVDDPANADLVVSDSRTMMEYLKLTQVSCDVTACNSLSS
jgi:peroxiredoxin (alkyl hydroperoxide reductase subunit C)